MPMLLRRFTGGMLIAALCAGCERPVIQPDWFAGKTIVQPDTGFYQELSWSPDGSKLLVSVLETTEGTDGYTFSIHELRAGHAGVTRLTAGPRDGWTSWAPDGTRIAFASERDDNQDVYVMDANGANPVRLTDGPAPDTHPDWSPDGSLILFTSARDGASQLFVMNADGSEQRRIVDGPGDVWNPVWSPDGSKIAFYETDEDGEDYIYIVNADGSGRTMLAAGVWPAWSPDRLNIIYGGDEGLSLVNQDGSRQTVLVAGDVGFGRFSPDGQLIAYISVEAGSVEVIVMRTDGSERVKLLRRPVPVW